METLRAIAPVVAVRGNNDRGDWAEGIPETAVVRIGSARLYVLHDLHQLDLDPERAGYQAVISGHSHRPGIERRGPVLFLNPGSAGPRRFSLPICLAHLQVRGREVEAEIIRLLG